MIESAVLAQSTSPVTLHPLTFGLVAAALLAVLALGLVAAYRRGAFALPGAGRLRALHASSDVPALASSTSGRVFWVNEAARRAGFAPGHPLAEQFSASFDIDEAALYRFHRGAVEFGFSLGPIEGRDGQRWYLAAQSPDGRSLVWTIQAPEDCGSTLERDLAFEAIDIGHAAVAADGRISTNARFRDLFRLPPGRVLDHLAAERPSHGRPVALPVEEGRDAFFRVFAIADPIRDRQDYLFLPVAEGEVPIGPEAVLDALPIALLGLDLDGRVVWSNGAARNLLGVDPGSGQPLDGVIEPLGRSVPSMLEIARRGLQGRGEMVRLAREGDDSFLQISLSRTVLDGQDMLLAVLADASQIRQLEDQFAQSQKMEAIGKLAGGVAHDFNNVLTAISGHADLLLLGKDGSHPDHSDLIQIRNNANRAATLVRQLLAFSRKQTLAPQDLSLQDVISDTLYLLDRLIGENVTLKLEHSRELGRVRADQQQLEQALMNLVVNARDAMPEGGTVAISTRNRSFEGEVQVDRLRLPAGDYVEITVEDEGPGIPEHLLDRIFEPFFTTKSVGEGTGLGLSTVYGIVKQSGGSITASNRPEGGARFRILLPRVSGEALPAPPVEPPRSRADMTGRGVVLLVEDEAAVRSFASRALRLRGYEVEAADSAERAMGYLSKADNPVDLIVSDVVMPGMDGPTFAAEARRLRPGLPVIFVSGYAEDSFRKSIMDDDFLFLAKPFSLSELTAKVKAALN